MTETAHTLLKSLVAPGVLPREISIEQVMRSFIRDKNYSENIVYELSHTGAWGNLITSLLLRGVNPNETNSPLVEYPIIFNYYGKRVRNPYRESDRIERYSGEPEEINNSDKMLTMLNTPRSFVGMGASGQYISPRRLFLPEDYLRAPIGIIGNGAASILLRRALSDIGFRHITTYEKRKRHGIWSQENVAEGSRNNPRNIIFGEHATLTAAPGSGDEIPNFLDSIDYDRGESPRIVVREVRPGKHYDHSVYLEGAEGPISYPILINAMGTGKPTPLSNDRMRGPKDRVRAFRWQNPLLQTHKMNKKMFVFVGLGNSTAEMLRVINKAMGTGLDIDYRILTHYPRDSIFNPGDTVKLGGKGYRMFRDISRPQLVSYQGDLPDARADYYRALLGNKILCSVDKWNEHRPGRLNVFTKNGFNTSIQYDELYVLTGYQHSEETFNSMGIKVDEKTKSAQYDYDGEFQSNEFTADRRLHRGYFGTGAVLDAPHNLNTVVIPGMAFRLPDLLFGIIMRAGEYAHKQREGVT